MRRSRWVQDDRYDSFIAKTSSTLRCFVRAGLLAIACVGFAACKSSGARPGHGSTKHVVRELASADGSCTSTPSGGPTLPSGWATVDIGFQQGGSTLYDSTTGSFIVTSSQKGVRRNGQGGPHCVTPAQAGGPYTGSPPVCPEPGGCQNNTVCMPDNDAARFVYREVTGDAEIVARVSCATGNAGSQVGMMIRESPNMFARMGALIVMRHMNNAGNSFSCDIAPAQPSEFNELWGSNRVQHPPGSFPTHQLANSGMPTRAMPGSLWLRLQRVGSGYVVSRSRDGVTWTQLTGGEFASPTAQIGFFVAGGESIASSTAVFDQVSVGTPQLAYKTTWIGSSYAALSTDFVSFGMHDFYVAPDGTSFKYSQHAEQGHSLNIVNSDGTLRKLATGSYSHYGFYQGGIAGDGARLYLGTRPGGSEIHGLPCTMQSTISRYTFDLQADGWSASIPGVLGGLAAANGKVFASSVSITNRTVEGGQPACPGVPPLTSRVRVLDPSAPPGAAEVGSFAFERPGPLAVQVGTDGIGRMWIIQGATEYPVLTRLDSGTAELSRFRTAPNRNKPNQFDYQYTGAVLCYEKLPNGSFGPCMHGGNALRVDASVLGYPSGTVFSPMGVTIDPGTDPNSPADDRLLIADNGHRQRIVICTTLGGVGADGQPSCTQSLGVSGGVFAGPTAGLTADGGGSPRFFSPLTVGVDAAKNIYVASSAPRVDIRKFTPAGAPAWTAPLHGLGTETGDFDPKSDGNDQHYYTAARHYVFHADRATTGSEWELKSITLNPFDGYSSSGRYEDTLYSGGPVWMRRFPAGSNEQLYMFRELGGVAWEILRFEGEVAVPCGSLARTLAGNNQFIRVWSDLDGDKLEDENEVESKQLPGPFQAASVDRDGNFWFSLGSDPAAGHQNAVWRLNRTGVASGAPTYDVANTTAYALPHTELFGRHVRYHAEQDALYVFGSKWSEQSYDWLSGPWCDLGWCPCSHDPGQHFAFQVIERYSGWLNGGGQASGPAYRLVMPEQRTAPTADDDFDSRYADPACHCNDFHWQGFDVAGDLLFVQENHGAIRVFPNAASGGGQSPSELTKLIAGPEASGYQFWTDVSGIARAVRRPGEYLVTTLDSSNQARTLTFRLGEPSPPSWTPAAVAPLAWYDASDAYVTHSGGVVSAWADRSGHGHTVSNTFPGGQPIYHLATWSSQPTVTFSGGQLLRRQGWSGVPAGTEQPFTVLAVMRSTAVQDASLLAWWSGVNTDAIRAALLPVGGSTRPNLGRDGDLGMQSFTPAVDLGSIPHVVAWRFANGTMTITVDGVTYEDMNGPLSSPGTLSFQYLLVGARSDLPTGLFRGDISELVVAPSHLSDGDLLAFRNYAKAKWSGLP